MDNDDITFKLFIALTITTASTQKLLYSLMMHNIIHTMKIQTLFEPSYISDNVQPYSCK